MDLVLGAYQITAMNTTAHSGEKLITNVTVRRSQRQLDFFNSHDLTVRHGPLNDLCNQYRAQRVAPAVVRPFFCV